MPAPRKYDEETRERALRMVKDRLAEGEVTQNAACREVGALLGIKSDTLRNWLKVPRAGSSGSTGKSESLEEENRRLRAENARLERANEILKTSSAFFAAAELDRKLR